LSASDQVDQFTNVFCLLQGTAGQVSKQQVAAVLLPASAGHVIMLLRNASTTDTGGMFNWSACSDILRWLSLLCVLLAGGLLRLQRVYGKKDLGNDWAAGAAAPAPSACGQPAVPAMAAAAAATFRRKVLKNSPGSRQRQQQLQQDMATPMQNRCGSSSSSSSSKSKRRKPSAAFGQLQYNVYNLDDYQFV
jgi:hypothetical protein